MTDRELLQQALDAMEYARQGKDGWDETFDNTVLILRAHLAQPEQEPVAYLSENAVGHKYFRWKKPTSIYKPIALYTAPPQRQPLTDEEKLRGGGYSKAQLERLVDKRINAMRPIPLTDERIEDLWKQLDGILIWNEAAKRGVKSDYLVRQYHARAIEAAHGIK